MKNLYLLFCLAFATCVTSTGWLQAQSYVISLDTVARDSVLLYADLGLSDPAMTPGEEFRIFLMVTNTGASDTLHSVPLYRQDASLAGGRILQQRCSVQLAAGETQEITFLLIPEEIVTTGTLLDQRFVFYLGAYEIGVEYVDD